MKALKVISYHATVTEAKEGSGIDYSYNPFVAKREAKGLDHDPNFEGAMIAVDAEEKEIILYAYRDPNSGVLFLNEFAPFSAMLTNSPFRLCMIGEDGKINFNPGTYGRDEASRKALARFQREALSRDSVRWFVID